MPKLSMGKQIMLLQEANIELRNKLARTQLDLVREKEHYSRVAGFYNEALDVIRDVFGLSGSAHELGADESLWDIHDTATGECLVSHKDFWVAMRKALEISRNKNAPPV